MKRSYLMLLVCLLSFCLAGTAFAAGGSKAPDRPAEDEPELTPEQRAEQRYNVGISMRDRAWKLEKKMGDADEAEQAKLKKKMEKAFKSAAREFEAAAGLKPDFHQAYSSLGYALRRIGDYENSLIAYDRSLAIEPNYTEAIEYRGQAYLGLGRLEDAQAAYMKLFDIDRPKADMLMDAMQSWLADKADASGLDAEQVNGFRNWVEERAQLASRNASLRTGQRSNW